MDGILDYTAPFSNLFCCKLVVGSLLTVHVTVNHISFSKTMCVV